MAELEINPTLVLGVIKIMSNVSKIRISKLGIFKARDKGQIMAILKAIIRVKALKAKVHKATIKARIIKGRIIKAIIRAKGDFVNNRKATIKPRSLNLGTTLKRCRKRCWPKMLRFQQIKRLRLIL